VKVCTGGGPKGRVGCITGAEGFGKTNGFGWINTPDSAGFGGAGGIGAGFVTGTTGFGGRGIGGGVGGINSLGAGFGEKTGEGGCVGGFGGTNGFGWINTPDSAGFGGIGPGVAGLKNPFSLCTAIFALSSATFSFFSLSIKTYTAIPSARTIAEYLKTAVQKDETSAFGSWVIKPS